MESSKNVIVSQIPFFVQLQGKNPDATVHSTPQDGIAPSSNQWKSCIWRPFLPKSYFWGVQKSIIVVFLPRFAVGVGTVHSTYNILVRNWLRMVSGCSRKVLELDKVAWQLGPSVGQMLCCSRAVPSETMPPIIAQLCNNTCPPP